MQMIHTKHSFFSHLHFIDTKYRERERESYLDIVSGKYVFILSSYTHNNVNCIPLLVPCSYFYLESIMVSICPVLQQRFEVILCVPIACYKHSPNLDLVAIISFDKQLQT